MQWFCYSHLIKSPYSMNDFQANGASFELHILNLNITIQPNSTWWLCLIKYSKLILTFNCKRIPTRTEVAQIITFAIFMNKAFVELRKTIPLPHNRMPLSYGILQSIQRHGWLVCLVHLFSRIYFVCFGGKWCCVLMCSRWYKPSIRKYLYRTPIIMVHALRINSSK